MKRLLILAVILLSVAACAQSNVAVWGTTYTPLAVADPTVTPNGGSDTNDFTGVTLATTTSGATLCYTTDGSAPAASTPGTCSAGSTYSGTLTIGSTGTQIKVLGTKSGLTNSNVVTSSAFSLAVANPTYNHGTSYSGGSIADLALTTSTTSGSVYYTSGASTPSDPACPSTGTLYSTPLTVSSTTYFKAIACKSNYTASSIVPATYTISGNTITAVVRKVGTDISYNTTASYSPALSSITVGQTNSMLVACFNSNINTASHTFAYTVPTDNVGNTWHEIEHSIDTTGDGSSSAFCWYTNPSNTTTLTVTFHLGDAGTSTAWPLADRVYATIIEIDGSSSVPVLDGTNKGTSSADPMSLAVTVGTTGDTLFGFGGISASAQTYGAGTGFTLLDGTGRQASLISSSTVSSGSQNVLLDVSSAFAGRLIGWAVK